MKVGDKFLNFQTVQSNHWIRKNAPNPEIKSESSTVSLFQQSPWITSSIWGRAWWALP